jgi:uncharacterized protein YjbJ (UPF0337 family)
MGEEKIEDAKGRIKEAAGDLTDDKDLKREGKLDRAGASVKEKIGDAADKLEEGVDKVRDKAQDAVDRD